jgi:hypothetical protein
LHRHPPVEAARAQQGRVEDVWAIRGAEHDHGVGRVEAVHLGEDLIECLFAFVVGAAQAVGTLAGSADRVELVYENDGGGGLLALGEQVADARRSHADDGLDELRCRDGKEGGLCFSRDRPGQERLARPRRPEKQHPVGYTSAQALITIRVSETVDYFCQLGLRFIDASHVVEADLDLLRVDSPGLGAAEVPQAADSPGSFRAARQQKEQPDQEQGRSEAQQ